VKLYELLHSEVPAPNLLVCLSASDDLLLKRIARRNRDFEQKIDGSYYVKINSAYEEFFRAYKAPKLLISMDEWDFVQTPELYGKLSAMVNDKILRAE
jgi:deoxyadenosine/deoxycytidine kinase